MSKDTESIINRLGDNCPPADDAYMDVMFTVSRLLPVEDNGAYKEIMDSVDKLCDRIKEAWQADIEQEMMPIPVIEIVETEGYDPREMFIVRLNGTFMGSYSDIGRAEHEVTKLKQILNIK